jgi:hypothetical protein
MRELGEVPRLGEVSGLGEMGELDELGEMREARPERTMGGMGEMREPGR